MAWVPAARGQCPSSFEGAVTYGTGLSPVVVAIGDLNGDGRLDLAVANSLDNTVSVLLGNGNGTFQAPINHNVGHFPYSVAAGDLNGDGRPDLAITNTSSNSVSVLLRLLGDLNGNGAANAADIRSFIQCLLTGASTGASCACGDFDNSGTVDLADVTPFVNKLIS